MGFHIMLWQPAGIPTKSPPLLHQESCVNTPILVLFQKCHVRDKVNIAKGICGQDILNNEYILHKILSSTYDHRSVKTGHPVRSAIHKH